MDDAKKLQFIAGMTAHALQHVASVPDTMAPDGKMSHDKKLAFVQSMTKHGLQYMASGGAPNGSPPIVNAPPVASQASAPTALAGAAPIGSPATTVNNTGLTGSIGNLLGLNNNFQAQSAQLQPGTNAQQLANSYSGAQYGLQQQQDLANTLNPGISQAAGNQSALADMELAQAQGRGPNPAQQQYQNNIQNLARQQAGAIASTKGISPALQARLISQEGSSAMQNAAGQGATLAAQQQIAAQNNLQNLSATQINQGAGAVQGINNAQQNEQNILQNANNAYNNANVSMTSNLNNVNSQTALANQQQAGNIVSGIGGLLSNVPVIGSLFAEGGKVHAPKMMEDGGLVAEDTSAPQSFVGQWLNSSQDTAGPQIQATPAAPMAPQKSSGGGGDALAGIAQLAMLASKGGDVKAANPGQKAVVNKDSLQNDKIPAMLSEGEVVMDKDTLNDPGKLGEMARAVAAHIEKRNKMKGKK